MRLVRLCRRAPSRGANGWRVTAAIAAGGNLMRVSVGAEGGSVDVRGESFPLRRGSTGGGGWWIWVKKTPRARRRARVDCESERVWMVLFVDGLLLRGALPGARARVCLRPWNCPGWWMWMWMLLMERAAAYCSGYVVAACLDPRLFTARQTRVSESEEERERM